MNLPVVKIRQRVLLILVAILACGAFTGCHDDYGPRRTYHRSYHRSYHRDYDRDDDYRYRRSSPYRGSYYGSGYRRSTYYAPGVTVHRGPVRTRAIYY